MKIYVIMLAGGKGSRMNASVNKVLIPVCGKTVIARSIEAFVPFVDEIFLPYRRLTRILFLYTTLRDVWWITD